MAETFSATVYIDANPVAYALEGNESLALAIKSLFDLFRQRPGLAVTSELTLAEVLPKRKVSDRDFLELLVWSRIFDLHPVSREILVETADYRRIASVKMPDGRMAMPKLPDAIHVVTAIRTGCSCFLSSDLRIKLPASMRLVRADLDGVASLIRDLT